MMGKFCFRVSLCTLAFVLLFAGMAFAAKKEPVKLGAVLSITGPNAPLGVPERDTLVLLAEQINKKGGIKGAPVELIIEDDASDPTNAVKAAKKLIEQDKVLAIIGSSGTGTTLAMVPLVERGKVTLISLSAGIAITNPLKKWAFRTAQTDVFAVGKLIDHLKKAKIKKIAVIYDSNPFGTSGKDQLVEQAPKAGIKILAQESFNSKDTDMTVQLTKIKGTKAQAIVCWGTNPGPAIIAKNIKQLGIKVPVFNSHGISNHKFIELGGSASEGIIFPSGRVIVDDKLEDKDPQKLVIKKYKKDFKAKFNYDADHFGGHAWDAFSILVKAITKVGNDREKIRNEVEKTKGFVGIGGIFTYSPKNHDGLGKDAFVLVKIEKGKWKIISK